MQEGVGHWGVLLLAQDEHFTYVGRLKIALGAARILASQFEPDGTIFGNHISFVQMLEATFNDTENRSQRRRFTLLGEIRSYMLLFALVKVSFKACTKKNAEVL